MNSIQTQLLKSLMIFLCAILIGGFAALSVNAQYGNLLSKAAVDALVAGHPQLCWDEMKALTATNEKNIDAHLESARCTFVAAVGTAFVERKTKELIAKGTSPADAKKEVEMIVQFALTNALNTINPVISINKSYSPAYNLRGAVYRAQGKNKEAEADFDLAIALDAKNFRAYANRGRLNDDLNFVTVTIADYEKAVALGINDPYITKRLSELKQKEKALNTVTAAEMEGFLKPENLKAVNDALKNVNETPPVQSKMTELAIRKQDISKKFSEFQTAYANPLSDSQKLEMLNRIKGEYQTALTEAETAERQNLSFTTEQKNKISEYKTYYSKALGILNGLIAEKKPTAAKTGEFSQSDLDSFYKQNPNFGASSAVKTVNRRSFYTGVFFQQTDLLALQSQMLGGNKQEIVSSMIKRLGALNAVLKGKPEAADLAEAYKKLQQSKNIQEFQKELSKVNSKYEASLTSEQKWYFKIGTVSTTVQYAAVNKQHIWFVTTKEAFSEFVKSSPAGTPLSLQTALRKMSQYANSRDLTAVNSDSDYALLETQIKEIFDSIGQLKSEDVQATSSITSPDVKQLSDNFDRADEMARKGDGSPYHLASHELTYQYNKLQEQRQDAETELMTKGNPGDSVRKKKFLMNTIALYTRMRDLMQRGLQELPRFKDSRWEAGDKAEFEKDYANSNKQIEKYAAQLKSLEK